MELVRGIATVATDTGTIINTVMRMAEVVVVVDSVVAARGLGLGKVVVAAGSRKPSGARPSSTHRPRFLVRGRLPSFPGVRRPRRWLATPGAFGW